MSRDVLYRANCLMWIRNALLELGLIFPLSAALNRRDISSASPSFDVDLSCLAADYSRRCGLRVAAVAQAIGKHGISSGTSVRLREIWHFKATATLARSDEDDAPALTRPSSTGPGRRATMQHQTVHAAIVWGANNTDMQLMANECG